MTKTQNNFPTATAIPECLCFGTRAGFSDAFTERDIFWYRTVTRAGEAGTMGAHVGISVRMGSSDSK